MVEEMDHEEEEAEEMMKLCWQVAHPLVWRLLS